MQYLVSCIRILWADEHFVCMKWDIFRNSLKKSELLEWGKVLHKSFIYRKTYFYRSFSRTQTCDSLHEKTVFHVNTEYSFKVNMLSVTTLRVSDHICYNRVSSLFYCQTTCIFLQTVDNVLETVMCCDKLLATLPNVRWAEPVFGITSQLLEASIKFIANNFCRVLSSDGYVYCLWLETKVMYDELVAHSKLKIWSRCLEHTVLSCVCSCMLIDACLHMFTAFRLKMVLFLWFYEMCGSFFVLQ